MLRFRKWGLIVFGIGLVSWLGVQVAVFRYCAISVERPGVQFYSMKRLDQCIAYEQWAPLARMADDYRVRHAFSR